MEARIHSGDRQGFGNVGSQAASLMHEEGYKIIGVADVAGGVLNPNGLNIPTLVKYVTENKTVQGFPGSENTGRRKSWNRIAKCCLPAATESVITSKNAHKIKARILVEGANSPTLPLRTIFCLSAASSSSPISWRMPVA